MKKITLVLGVFLTLVFSFQAAAQKVVVIGANHTSPDGISFVATQAISNGEVIYFSEDEYNNVSNVFSSGESVVQFTASTAIAVGEVIFLKEVSTNTLTVTCSSGSCGTAVVITTPFALGSSGEHMYAYSDTDADPTNGVTEIYSVFYTFAGTIPAGEDPTVDFPTAVVVDGFASGSPDRTEFNASRDGVSKVTLENPSNYTNGAANADLDLSAFTNLNLAGVNPTVTLTSTPASVVENSGNTITYTFSRTGGTGSPLTVNFNVAGTATFNTDYTQSGAATFSTTNGTVTIGSGNSSAAVTITPSPDSDLEPNETVQITVAAGTGYDAGSPGMGTGTIDNDDTENITPLVAVVGTTHSGTEGFSFVALDDITAGTNVYFTENSFDMGALAFTGPEAVIQWTAPAGGISRGEVIVATESAPNVFTSTCNSGTCGTTVIVSGNFSLANNGEAFFAYQDTDTDHTNGITQVDAVLFTGTATTPGGNIPTAEDPTTKYLGAVLVDGFPAVPPSLTEYDPSKRGTTVDQANFQNTTNWLHAQPAGALNTTPFSNIIIASGSANPAASVTVAPAGVAEDGATNLVFTFSLDETATSDITVNFTVGGTATFSTDYTVSGAASFDAMSGSVVISNGTSSAEVTVDPTADPDVEVQETVEIMIAAGTGYDGGSPNDATGTITNDDTSASMPLVALTGLNHTPTDGFSFVAARDIPAGSTVYFTEDEYDNTTLLFAAGGEAVLQWTSPGFTIPKGDVIVVDEPSSNTFALSCSGTGGADCGSLTLISGSFSTATDGETFYAYADDDTDPTNGVTDIYAVLYTGVAGSPGGNIPASEDPSGIFTNALVVDGFPATAPDRTEYDPTKRNVPVTMADFEDISNWVHAQTNAILSAVPFTGLVIVDTDPPIITCPTNPTAIEGCSTTDVSPTSALAFSELEVTIAEADFIAEGGTIGETGTTVTYQDVATGIGVHPIVVTRTFTVTDSSGNSATCDQVFTIQDTTPPVITTCPPDTDVMGISTDDIVTSGASALAFSAGLTLINSAQFTGEGGVFTDNCSPQRSITYQDVSSGTCPIVVTRTFTIEDLGLSTVFCVQTFTIKDNEDPVITCPANISTPSSDGSPVVVMITPATATDNCDPMPTVTFERSDDAMLGLGDPFPVGTTQILWTATDLEGNTDMCMQDVTITFAGSMANDIVSFSVPGQVGMSAIDATAKTVMTQVAPGTDLMSLVPTIGISPAAMINPASGVAQDFTSPVLYTVTAEDGTPQVWTVTITEQQLIDLELDFGVDNAVPNVGDLVSFTMVVTNQGPSTATAPVSGTVDFGSGYVDVINVISVTNATVTIPAFTPPGPLPTVSWQSISGLAPGASITIVLQTRVGASGDYLTLAEVTSANETDVDSTPNNGVDTDGDMNFVDDPGDEDDGDGEFVTPAASVGDRVFDDQNFNGIQDGGEPGVGGITVNLQDCSGTTLATTTTAGDGSYQFNGLQPNLAYRLLFSNIPAGYVFVAKDVGGDDTIDSDVDMLGFTSCFTLAPGEENDTYDAGIQLNQLAITQFVLVNADTDTDIMPLSNGDVIDVSTLPTMNLNIRADATMDTESVQLMLTGSQSNTRTENVAPYALFGDSSGNYAPHVFAIGPYHLSATPYSGNNLSGMTGTGASINFEFVNTTVGSPLILVDASTDTQLMALTEGTVINKSVLGDLFFGVIYNASLNPNGVRFTLTGPINENRAEGSSPPYSLFGDIGVDIQGKKFPAGAYTLVAKPNSGPQVTVNFTVIDVDPACVAFDAFVDSQSDPTSCEGLDGQIVIGASGFTAPLTYAWSHDLSLNSATASGLGAGPFTVTVTDDNGCSETLMVSLSDPPTPIVTLDPFADVFDTDPAFALTGGMPAGGIFSGPGVSGGMFDPSIGAGMYEITYEYTDGNGCSGSDSQFITVLSTSVNAITGFVVVNADSDGDLFPLVDGALIDISILPTLNLNIRANATADVESVRLVLSGASNNSRTENFAPYALFGDLSGDYLPGNLLPGSYSLTATPYTGNNLSGTAGTPMTVNFNVIDGGGGLFLKIYPNPAVSEMEVEMRDLNEETKIYAIQIHNMQGQLVKAYGTKELSDSNQFKMPVAYLQAGVYTITVVNNKGSIQKKAFVVNK